MSLPTTKIPYLTRAFNAACGCSAGCPYCWARRFARRLACPDCRAGRVHLHPERLGQPAATKTPQVVGVTFMGDLFDPERPVADIEQVLDACRAAPWHQYVFLTRHVGTRARLWRPRFVASPNWWIGTTVTGDERPDHDRLNALRDWADAGARIWLSLEPWFGPWESLDALWKCDLVVLGSLSGPGARLDPESERRWHANAAAIVQQCRQAGVPVYVKQAWARGRCSRDPAEWPEELRVQELPAEWAAILAAEAKGEKP